MKKTPENLWLQARPSFARLACAGAIGLATLLAVSASQAAVMKFDSDTQFHNGSGAPYSEAGYQLANSSGDGSAIVFWGQSVFNAHGALNSNNTFTSVAGPTTMTLTKNGGGAFDFLGVELAEWRNTGTGGDVQFNFTFADNSLPVSLITVQLDHNKELEFFNFGVKNVVKVEWTAFMTKQNSWLDDAGDVYESLLQVDHVAVQAASLPNCQLDTADACPNAVPEPGSMALMSLGLLGVWGARGKKHRVRCVVSQG